MLQFKKPVIGVTGPNKGGWPAWIMTWWQIRRAGGRAIHITPQRPVAIDEIDGLIIGGGADVDPSLYNREKIIPELRKEHRKSQRSIGRFLTFVLLWLLRRAFSAPQFKGSDRGRDKIEVELLLAALDRRLPVLGICRGMQLINVCYGGTLYQDILGFYQESPQLRTVLPKKTIEITHHTKLHQLIGSTSTLVNSLHNQSVEHLGPGLRVSAKEPNGVIQAIECVSSDFVLGVQWHPEYMPQDEGQANIFKTLVRACVAKVFTNPTPDPATETKRNSRTRQHSREL